MSEVVIQPAVIDALINKVRLYAEHKPACICIMASGNVRYFMKGGKRLRFLTERERAGIHPHCLCLNIKDYGAMIVDGNTVPCDTVSLREKITAWAIENLH